MRAWAVAASQRSVPTLSMPIWPDLILIVLVVDQRLQHRHGAVVEEEGVVVVRRTAEQLDVPRLGVREALLEARDQRVGLQDADAEIVERGVVVHVRRVFVIRRS